MSVNVQLANELRRISGQNTTQAQIMLALGYTPANDTEFLAHAKNGSIHVSAQDRERWNNALGSGFSGNYNDLLDKPDIFNDNSGTLQITDNSGNIIAQVDRYGIKSVNFFVKGVELSEIIRQSQFNIDYNNLLNRPDIYEDNSGKISYADPNGNIIAEFSGAGLNTVGIKVKGVDILTLVAQGQYTVDYNLLINRPDIYEDGSGEMAFADIYGNVVATIGAEGLNAIDVRIKGKSIAQIVEEIGFTGDYNTLLNRPNIEEVEEHRLIIADDSGNIVAEINNEGIRAIAYYSGSDGQDLATHIKNLQQTVSAHTGDTNIHITSTERTNWNTAKEQLTNHTSSSTIHITDAERQKWNAITGFSGKYTDLTGAPKIDQNANGDLLFQDLTGKTIGTLTAAGAFSVTTILVGGEASNILERIVADETALDTHKKDGVLHITADERLKWNGITPHINNTTIHITATERNFWTNKSDFSGSYLDLTNKPDIASEETGAFIIVDNLSNKIMQVDSEGLHVHRLEVNGVELLGELNGKAPTQHTHSYAGSGSPGGTANAALQLEFQHAIAYTKDSNSAINMVGTVCIEVPHNGSEKMQFFVYLHDGQTTVTTPYWFYAATKRWTRVSFTYTKDVGWKRAAVYYIGTQNTDEFMEITSENYPNIIVYFNTK